MEAAMRVQDVMSENVKTIAPSASAEDARSMMRLHRIHHLVVTKGSRVVGVLSDRDLGGPRAAILRTNDVVADLMTAPVVTVEPTTTIRQAANVMRGRSIGCLVVKPAATAGQNLQVQQAGCRCGISASTINLAATGGTGRVDVLQQSEPLTCGGATQDRCVWTARSDASWITVTTSMPQMGDNPVSFTVAANTSTSARTGMITVRDRVVRITQAGR
jgi:CBS domain-containing protein